MTASTGDRADRDQEREYPIGPGDVPADTFALRLMASRHHAGRLSIEQAATRCGLNPGNWAHWENGRRPLDKLEIAQAVAEGLDMNLHWLVWGGPLLPARGRPTKRSTPPTLRYPARSVRPPGSHPNGRGPNGRGPLSGSPAQATRAHRPIDRSKPVAA